MAKGLNKVMLIGNVGKEPELKYTTNGVAVCTTSLATSESWKDESGAKQEKTEWHNLVAWRKTGEIIAEYVKKGDKLYVEGKIQTRSYEDKNGVKRYITEIVVSDITMLGGVMQEQSQASAPQAQQPEAEDDRQGLPF